MRLTDLPKRSRNGPAMDRLNGGPNNRYGLDWSKRDSGFSSFEKIQTARRSLQVFLLWHAQNMKPSIDPDQLTSGARPRVRGEIDRRATNRLKRRVRS